jgi:hypothetical protein
MSPRVRAHYAAYQEAEALEEELADLPPLALLPGLVWPYQHRDQAMPRHAPDHAADGEAEWYEIEVEGEEGEGG